MRILLTEPTQPESPHELAQRFPDRQELRAIHAPDDVADDRAHHLLHARHAEAGRLLHHKARFGGLERL